MKTYAVIMLIVLCPHLPAQAAIINGYLYEKIKLEKKINKTIELLEDSETDKATRQIEKDLKRLQKKYEIVAIKYSDTERLISTVELIDPEIFEAVSKVTNAEGTLTHVYVRCVNRVEKEFTYFVNNHFNAIAYTSARPAKDNENVCSSIFGINTITITVSKGHSEIIALAHEFAHVLYVVPNFDSYLDYTKNNKEWMVMKKFGHGHHPFDPGQHFVRSLENSFRDKYKKYVKKLKYSNIIDWELAISDNDHE